MPSVFSKIVNEEISCFKVHEDKKHLAFLDISPNTKGHTLCIPKKENDYIFDMSETEFLDLMKFARIVALGIKSAIDCSRVAISVVGMEINHTHIHLIPIKSEKDVNFNFRTGSFLQPILSFQVLLSMARYL